MANQRIKCNSHHQSWPALEGRTPRDNSSPRLCGGAPRFRIWWGGHRPCQTLSQSPGFSRALPTSCPAEGRRFCDLKEVTAEGKEVIWWNEDSSEVGRESDFLKFYSRTFHTPNFTNSRLKIQCIYYISTNSKDRRKIVDRRRILLRKTIFQKPIEFN